MVHRSTLFRRRKRLLELLGADSNKRARIFEDSVDHPTINIDHSADSNLTDSNASDDKVEWFDIDEEHVSALNSINIRDFDEYLSRKLNDFPTEKEIATALILLKARHKLSNVCVNHICYLLRLLKISKAPRSYARIARLFSKETSSNVKSTMINICNKCNQICTSPNYCDNTECSQHEASQSNNLQFLYMPILPQIRDIVKRTKHINFKRQNLPLDPIDTMKDISDGLAYDRILSEEQPRFLTLLMNVDGIQVDHSSNTSLWVISLIINELERNERFKLKNVIVAGVSSGKSKPSRDQMFAMLTPIVQELKQLEDGKFLELSSSENGLETLRVFLLAATLDKPAQSLVQNLAEPIGIYGCGRCELAGITVPVQEGSTNKIRVFPLLPTSQAQPRPRSNMTHDEIVHVDDDDKPTDPNELVEMMRGHVGQCVLRDLKYFDVGQSFLSDSLHNIYHGVMKRLLKLWFDRKYRREPWSIYSSMSQIDAYLSKYQYPSNLTRMPRSILKHHLFKGNELRSLLLYGFPAFKSALPPRYYNHFLLFVIGTHLVELRSIDQNQIELIDILYEKFLRHFPRLYTERHNVQCVHSLHHFSASVNDCGSTSNFSTFNFESVLGILTGSIHATRRHGIEIENNIRLLRAACIEIEKSDFNPSLHKFINNIQRTKRTIIPDIREKGNTMLVRVWNRNNDANSIQQIQQSLNNHTIELFKSCNIGSHRYTTSTDENTSAFADSCILFLMNDNLRLGFIRQIIRIKGTNEYSYLYQIQLVTIKSHLRISLDGNDVSCKNVLFGSMDSNKTFVYIKPEQILEKIIHVYDERLKKYIFFRFPNLFESS